MQELRSILERLGAERAEIEAQTAPLRAERDRLLAEIAPQLTRERELGKKIKALELPRLAEIDQQRSAIAAALKLVEPNKHARLSDQDATREQ